MVSNSQKKTIKKKSKDVFFKGRGFDVSKQGKITRFNVRTKAGNRMEVFYNTGNDLFVVDKIGGKGGNEIVRVKAKDIEVP